MVAPQFLAQNLALLESQQPALARTLRGFVPELSATIHDTFELAYSRSGHPIPVLRGQPLHSPEDPVLEGELLSKELLAHFPQSRIAIFGFAFGYHVTPFVKKGLSPIVYEPSLALLHFAFSHADLSAIIPFVSFHTGPRTPDLPRNTLAMTYKQSEALYPEHAAMFNRKVIDHIPPKTNDMEEGAYYFSYRNITTLKNPCDLVIYQMLLWLVRPTLILEIGVCRGGSALYLADLLRVMGGDRRIHAYDIVDEVPSEVLSDPLITYYTKGWQEFDPAIIRKDDRVLIIEDSAHTYENTAEVLERFAPYVSQNSYLIVEDTMSGDTRPAFNGGPIRAIREFLPKHPEFEVDPRWENFFGSGSSFNLDGFLRRK